MATITTSSPFSCTSLNFKPSSISISISNSKLFLHSSPPHLPLSHHSTASAGVQGNQIDEVFFDDNGFTDYDSDDDDDDTDSSIDLLIRFFHSMFKKISRRAKKSSRLILPSVISPQLVSFAVDGILLLAALSIVKALLEVVCTLGSTVFTAILLLRVMWAAISYFQSNGNTFNQGGNSFGGSQPVT